MSAIQNPDAEVSVPFTIDDETLPPPFSTSTDISQQSPATTPGDDSTSPHHSASSALSSEDESDNRSESESECGGTPGKSKPRLRYHWTCDDTDALFESYRTEFLKQPSERLPGGFWPRVRKLWIAKAGHTQENLPSARAIMSKIHGLHEMGDMRYLDLKRKVLSGNKASTSRAAKGNLAKGKKESYSGGQRSLTSRYGSISTLPDLKGRHSIPGPRRWDPAEDRLLLKLYAQAAKRPNGSINRATLLVAKQWAPIVDGRRYRSRTASALIQRLQILSKTPALQGHVVAQKLRRTLKQRGPSTTGAAAGSAMDTDKDEDAVQGAPGAVASHSSQVVQDGVGDRFSASRSHGREEVHNSQGRASARAAGQHLDAAAQAKFQELENGIRQLQSRVEEMSGKASTPAGGQEGEDMTEQHQQTTAFRLQDEGAGSSYAQLRHRLTAVATAQEEFRSRSEGAWMDLRTDELKTQRRLKLIEEVSERMMRAVSAVQAGQKQQDERLEQLWRRVDELAYRREQRERDERRRALREEEFEPYRGSYREEIERYDRIRAAPRKGEAGERGKRCGSLEPSSSYAPYRGGRGASPYHPSSYYDTGARLGKERTGAKMRGAEMQSRYHQ